MYPIAGQRVPTFRGLLIYFKNTLLIHSKLLVAIRGYIGPSLFIDVDQIHCTQF